MTRLPPQLARNLRIPAIAAPMFLVSGPQMVISAARAGDARRIVSRFNLLPLTSGQIVEPMAGSHRAAVVGWLCSRAQAFRDVTIVCVFGG